MIKFASLFVNRKTKATDLSLSTIPMSAMVFLLQRCSQRKGSPTSTSSLVVSTHPHLTATSLQAQTNSFVMTLARSFTAD